MFVHCSIMTYLPVYNCLWYLYSMNVITTSTFDTIVVHNYNYRLQTLQVGSSPATRYRRCQ